MLLRIFPSVFVISVSVLLVTRGIQVRAVPVEELTNTANETVGGTPLSQDSDANEIDPSNPLDSTLEADGRNLTDSDTMQASGSEMSSSVQLPDPLAESASSYNPSIYAGLLTPDAFQQYVNQFGGPYAPAYAGYPAPVGYAPAAPNPYPGGSPYVVQTGYEGYLMPTDTTSSDSSTAATAGTSVSASTAGTNGTLVIGGPFYLLGQLIQMLFNSSLARVVMTIVSAVGMIFAGGILTTLICNFTPLCNITFRTVAYLKRRAATDGVQRLIAEEVTPERVRRTTEFVRNAIRKYRELQKMAEEPRS